MDHPSPIAPRELLSSLRWRYAVKQFDNTRKIDAPVWTALEESLLLSPSSFGLQPWKFIVIDDSQLRTQLRVASWNQSQITDASHLVVFARRSEITSDDVERYVERIAQVRGVTTASVGDYKKLMLGSLSTMDASAKSEWSARQVYIALGFFLEAAALLGVDACPMEGIDPAKYDAMLGLAARGYTTTVAATVGYRAASDLQATLAKVRFPMDQIIEHR